MVIGNVSQYADTMPFYKKEELASLLTDKSYGLWEVYREVLTPVIGDGYLQVVDAAALRLEGVRKVRRHVQHVL